VRCPRAYPTFNVPNTVPNRGASAAAQPAKHRDKPYRSGRSPDWIKVKNPDAPAATRILE